MSLDLRKYVQQPQEWEWAEREEKRLEAIGKINLSKMQNEIYNTLLKVPEGQYFDIEKNVKPENHEIFIKTCCEFLIYYPNYRFNRLMNKFYNDAPIKIFSKKNTNEKKE